MLAPAIAGFTLKNVSTTVNAFGTVLLAAGHLLLNTARGFTALLVSSKGQAFGGLGVLFGCPSATKETVSSNVHIVVFITFICYVSILLVGLNFQLGGTVHYHLGKIISGHATVFLATLGQVSTLILVLATLLGEVNDQVIGASKLVFLSGTTGSNGQWFGCVGGLGSLGGLGVTFIFAASGLSALEDVITIAINSTSTTPLTAPEAAFDRHLAFLAADLVQVILLGAGDGFHARLGTSTRHRVVTRVRVSCSSDGCTEGSENYSELHFV